MNIDAWIEPALAVLGRGGAVAVATESFFALAVDATSSRAVDWLFALKNRDLGKGIGLMVPHESWRHWVTEVPEGAAKLAREFWPGPLSLVLPAQPRLDRRLVVDGYVALRVPGPSMASQLVEAFGRPLTATSANLPGRPPCRTDAEVARCLPASDEFLIVAGECPGGQVSSLVRFAGDEWTMVRKGAVSSELLRRVLVSS